MAAKDGAPGGHEARRHEILVRGAIGPTMMQAFPTLAASRNGQDTRLTSLLPDQSALYGVTHQLEALGLQLLEIRRLPTSDLEQATPWPTQRDGLGPRRHGPR